MVRKSGKKKWSDKVVRKVVRNVGRKWSEKVDRKSGRCKSHEVDLVFKYSMTCQAPVAY